MAVFGKFKNASVTLNSVDVSAFVRSISLTATKSGEAIGAMGDTWIPKTFGAKEWSLTLDLWQSFYTAEVDATLWAVFNDNDTVTVEIYCDGGSAVSATNPKYNGTVGSTAYNPIDGEFDSNLATSISLEGADTLTRSTS